MTARQRFLTACAAIALTCSSWASASVVWTGAVNNNFNTGRNWDSGIAPGAADDVEINLATAPNQARLQFSSATVSSINLTAGSLTLLGSRLTSTTGVSVAGSGLLSVGGASIVEGDVSVGGLGQLALTGFINGDLGLSGNASLLIAQSSYLPLVNGDVTLDAHLVFSLLNALTTDTTVVDVLLADSFSGAFDDITVQGLNSGYSWTTQLTVRGNKKALQLVFTRDTEVPEPPTVALIALALAGVGWRARR